VLRPTKGAAVPGYYDVYVLAPARTAEAVERFLRWFAPKRTPWTSEFSVPQFADEPATVFRTADELIAYCVAHPTEPHGIYWRCPKERDPAYAMVFFTPDAGLIFGLSVLNDAERWRAELMDETGSESAWVGFEDPPPDTVAEFAALAASQTAQGIERSRGAGT
jgi:hypothetical protein